MNRLPINPVADKKFMEYCGTYYKRLLARADIYARQRDGNSIETGDFDLACEDIENRGRRAQFFLAAGSAAIGAGISGVVQNLLDGKSTNYAVAFLAVLFFGVLIAYDAIFRK